MVLFNYIYSTATWQAIKLPHLKIRARLSFPLMSLNGGDEVMLPMQARRGIIREASGGYNKLSKKEKMARFRFRGSRCRLQSYPYL